MRIVLLIALFVLAFGGSFAGVYLNMDTPTEPAESVAEPGAEESTPSAATRPPAATVAPAGAGAVVAAAASAGRDVGALTDSLGREAWETTLDSRSDLVGGLLDSLSAARGQIIAMTARTVDLEDEIDFLKEARDARQSKKEVATAMASTLPKLDQKELTPILDGLDDSSLDDLYEAASSRNRTAILQALKPERASDLVERFISAPQGAPLTPVSSNSQQNSSL
ncbi:MAG: hypothetical protein ACI80V_001277 [Rhodothermales bacterium]|jgi:hypothetical protein